MNNTLDTTFILKFPEPFKEPEYKGICLITEDIDIQVLYSAYMQGVFPWFNEDDGDPVIWYSPDPRFCIRIENLHIPKSLSKFIKHTPYTYTMDKCFVRVMEECRNVKRQDQDGTWIGPKIINSYSQLHQAGLAHSFEVWHEERLVGGFYGVLIGSVFCGESMFTKMDNSSKSAFALFAKAFAECGGKLIDSQVYTDNIARYGAENISRNAFLRLEKEYLYTPLKYDLKEKFLEIVGTSPTILN